MTKMLSCRIKCEKEYKKFFSHLFFAVHGKVIKILKQKIILKQLLKKINASEHRQLHKLA